MSRPAPGRVPRRAGWFRILLFVAVGVVFAIEERYIISVLCGAVAFAIWSIDAAITTRSNAGAPDDPPKS